MSALDQAASDVAAGAGSAPTRLGGTAASPGFAIGPVWRYRAAGAPSGGSTATTLSIAEAAAIAATDLQALAERVRLTGRTAEAEIFEAQAMMAADPLLVDAASQLATDDRATGAAALADAVAEAAASVAAMFAGIEDELLAARAADVRDVGARIGRVLLGLTIEPPTTPSIAIADDLPPSVTVDLPAGSLIGIALESGTRTSHAAILARGLGIPAVVGVGGLLAALEAEGVATGPGDPSEAFVAVDGDAGVVILRPDESDATAQRERARAGSAAAAAARTLRGRPGATRDGHAVPLLANIGRPEDAGPAIATGAEGVGLFRTEFVFMGRSAAPTEEEQVRAYAEVLGQFGRDRPVVIRLADIGGDKAIPYLGLPAEANPFLGVRGLRLAYEVARPLLVTQIRAIARAGAASGTVPHLMAPMVATLEDVQLLLDLRAEAFAALDREGTARAERIVTGIMVEVPSAALIADRLAPHVDFVSIGSNDLTQYTLAADRTNGKLGSLQDALHPAVLSAIASTVRGADSAGIPVAVCGELASDPAGALVLVGLGVDELSMEPTALDPIRLRLSERTYPELEDLARDALAAPSAAAVREIVRARFAG